jgi:hypothetical protein
LKLFNPNYLTVKEQWKLLTFHPLELIVGKLYNHTVGSFLFLKISFAFFKHEVKFLGHV